LFRKVAQQTLVDDEKGFEIEARLCVCQGVSLGLGQLYGQELAAAFGPLAAFDLPHAVIEVKRLGHIVLRPSRAKNTNPLLGLVEAEFVALALATDERSPPRGSLHPAAARGLPYLWFVVDCWCEQSLALLLTIS